MDFVESMKLMSVQRYPVSVMYSVFVQISALNCYYSTAPGNFRINQWRIKANFDLKDLKT